MRKAANFRRYGMTNYIVKGYTSGAGYASVYVCAKDEYEAKKIAFAHGVEAKIVKRTNVSGGYTK